MAKRRSSTRVGRNHPRPATPPLLPLVVVASRYRATAPVMLNGTIYRVIESPAAQRIVQEWVASGWMPSLLPLYRVADAMLATPAQLRRADVPASEWQATPLGTWRTDTSPEEG